MSTSPSPSHLRSLYRRLLRELPHRQPSRIANPSPIQKRIRTQFSTAAPLSSPTVETAAVDQFVQYLRSQRIYTTLLERYNPGINMAEEDRVRLTARRVGLDVPVEVKTFVDDGGESGEK